VSRLHLSCRSCSFAENWGSVRRFGVVSLCAPVLAALLLLPPMAAVAADDFYTAPSPLAIGAPGALIRTQPAPVLLAGVRATTVMYHSRTAHNDDVAVTGTVFTPTAPWTGAGPRPWVDLAVGTQGLGPQCAPSKQFVANTESEIEPVAAALTRGWGVAVSDYEGYTSGSTPTYVAGLSEGHTVLDMARAARALAGTGISSATPWATMGYSQGGGASSWAASLAPSYAPDINLITDVSGGVPADVRNVAESLDGNVGAGLMLDALVGLQQADPERFPLDPTLNETGRAAVATVKTQCVVQTLASFPFSRFSQFSQGSETIQQFDARPDVASVFAENNLGDRPAPTVPILQYHGVADEIVPLGQARALHDQWCAKGARAVFTLVAGDHIAAETAGLPAAIGWLSDRFAGLPAPTGCKE
jgi:hypothetical protein